MYGYTFDGVNYGDLFSTDRPSNCDYCGREVEQGAMKICIECTRVGWCSKECEEAGRGEHKLPCQIISSAQSDILRQDFTPDTSMEGLRMTWCDPPPNFHLLHAAAAAALKPMMDDVQDDVHKSGGGKAFWKREYEGEAVYKPFFEELVEHEGEWMEFFRHEKHSYHCMVTVQILNTLVTVHCKRGAFDDCSQMLVLYFKVLRVYRNACSRRGGTGESYCDGMENRGRLAQFHMNCVLEKYEANISILRKIACHEAKYPEGDGTPYGHSNYLALFSKRTEKRKLTAEEIMAHPRKDFYLYVKFIAESSKFKKFAKKEHKRTKLLVCDHCGKEETGMKQYKICPRCTNIAYCSKDCQSKAWKSHTKVCGKQRRSNRAQLNLRG